MPEANRASSSSAAAPHSVCLHYVQPKAYQDVCAAIAMRDGWLTSAMQFDVQAFSSGTRPSLLE